MQIHAFHDDLMRAFFNMLKSEQVVRKARSKALRLVDNGLAEAFAQRGRHVGIHEGFGVAANGRKRRAQLVGHVANKARLSVFLHGKVAHLGFCFCAQGNEVFGKLVGLVKLAFRLNIDARVSMKNRLRAHVQIGKGLGQVVANDEAQRERERRARKQEPEKQPYIGNAENAHQKKGEYRSRHGENSGQNGIKRLKAPHNEAPFAGGAVRNASFIVNGAYAFRR